MNVAGTLIEAASNFKNKAAFIYEGQEFSFFTLKENSLRLAAALVSLGVKKADRVAIYLPNCPEYVYAYLAAYSLGAVVVPLDFSLQEDEIVNMLKHCEAKVIITTLKTRFPLDVLTERIPSLEEIIIIERDSDKFESLADLISRGSLNLPEIEINEDDYSTIYYTSGSTGRPKGVLWNFRHLHLGVDSLKHFLDISPLSRTIAAVPFSHSAGVLFPAGAIKYGMSFVIMKRFSPLEFVRFIQDWKVTLFWIVPAMFTAILHIKELDKYDLSSLQWAAVFGASSNPEIIRRFKRHAPNTSLVNGWGMTETSPPTMISEPDNVRSIGKVPPGIEIRIIDLEDRPVPYGEIGEVVIRGNAVCLGYYKDPQLTSQMFRNGWFHTQDLGKFDKGGNLYIVGRIKEMIKIGGQIVFAPEVEEAICNHPGVAEVAVIGVEDKLRGEVPKAFVVLKRKTIITEQELRNFCKQHLAHFKVPRYFEFRESLPRTGSGKIDKANLEEKDR